MTTTILSVVTAIILIGLTAAAIIFMSKYFDLRMQNQGLQSLLDDLQDRNRFALDELAAEQERSTRLFDKNTRLNNELTFARQEVSAANAATEEVRYQLSEALLRELPRLEELRQTPAKINTILSDEG